MFRPKWICWCSANGTFDCIPHDLFIAKMHEYGFSFKINNEYRVFQTPLSRVLQKSMIGPIFFNIFINDLFYWVKNSELHNSADDSTIPVVKLSIQNTAWKVSKYGVFSGPYFPAFGLNTEICGVNIRI